MQIAEAFESFVAEPVRRGRADLAIYRLSQFLHDRTNGKFDSIFMKIARHLKPKQTLPTSVDLRSVERDEVVADLRRDGNRILPFKLAEQDIAEIKAFAFSTPAYDKNINDVIAVAPGAIPPGRPRFVWRMGDLVKLQAIKRIILNGPYCAIAQEYLGCRPLLAHVNLMLDAPCEGVFEPYQYHYDNDGPAFLKFFLFLTDISPGTGAHHFIVGSQGPTKPPSVARSGLYSDEQIFAVYERCREVVAQGPAGTILAEDTKGFHRGSEITRDFRLLLQLEFSILQVPTEEDLAAPFPQVAVPDLHTGIAAIVRKFYTRA
jgi:hypothetical protein